MDGKGDLDGAEDIAEVYDDNEVQSLSKVRDLDVAGAEGVV